MDLTPKQFLLINALVVIPIAVSLLFLRRGQKPSQLNLHADEKNPKGSTPKAGPKSAPEAKPNQPQNKGDQRPQTASTAGPRKAPQPQAPRPQAERSLNVFFQWNGHAWDAYEALGIPAGSSLDAVTAAYQKSLKQGDPDSVLFFKAAYEAIMRGRA